jgi:hypothetical protein
MAGAFEDERGGESTRRRITEEGELISREDQLRRRCHSDKPKFGAHSAPLQPHSLRFAEKPVRIDVAS